jgi:hypothetical protein
MNTCRFVVFPPRRTIRSDYYLGNACLANVYTRDLAKQLYRLFLVWDNANLVRSLCSTTAVLL